MATKTKPFHQRMKDRREAASLKVDDVLYALRSTAPEPWWVSRSTIHRLESPAVKEASVDAVLLWYLAQIYGCPLSALSPGAAAAMNRLNEVLTPSSWNGVTAGRELSGVAA